MLSSRSRFLSQPLLSKTLYTRILRTTATRSTSSSSTTSSHNKLTYDDDYIKSILSSTKTIAMVGASTNWTRPSYFAMKYLQGKGYRIIPINPRAAGETLLGETVYASIKDIPSDVEIDMVDIFRKPQDVPPIARDAMDIGAKHLWMQLGVINEDAANDVSKEGMNVVMNRCPKIEFSRLYGELGWGGIDSKVISSKKRPVGHAELIRETEEHKPHFEGFDTKSIHSGAAPCPTTGARATPIYQTTAYVFDSIDQAAQLFNLQAPGNIYTRLTNPTNSVLEQRMAALEKGRGATVTSSGHAAQLLALFPLMEPGDKLISSDKLYGGSLTQLGKTILKFGWNCDFVNVDDSDAVRKALAQPRVKAMFVESLANPGGNVTDLEDVAEAAHEVGVPLLVDNTLATPFLCNPIDYGADIVIHSTTKFISGHGNSMGGVVIDSGTFDWAAEKGKFPSLAEPEMAYHGLTFVETFGDLAYTTHAHAVGLRDLGATMAPFNAFLTITGCETLSLRMERHVDNALAVARWLEADPRVSWVSYAGLESSPYYELAKKYTPRGAGSVFTFGVEGGFDVGSACVERVNLISHLANMGDTRSLILHPASTTHRQLTQEQREKAGAGDDVLRLSIGLESVEDIIKDLDYALMAVK